VISFGLIGGAAAWGLVAFVPTLDAVAVSMFILGCSVSVVTTSVKDLGGSWGGRGGGGCDPGRVELLACLMFA